MWDRARHVWNRRRGTAFVSPVLYRVTPLLFVLLTGCTAAPPRTEAVPASRPLEVLPTGVDSATVRSDLLATARDRFGEAALDRALGAPTHLIVKRFAGMAPPPPPGAGPDWRVPTPAALLIREGSNWLVATPEGWRSANAQAAAELDSLLGTPNLWSEPFYTPACPDYGASLLLLKVPGKAETLRNSQCTSLASRVVEDALRA